MTPFYPLNYEDESGCNFTSSVEPHCIDEVDAARLPCLRAQREAAREVVEDEQRAQCAGQAALICDVEIPRKAFADGDGRITHFAAAVRSPEADFVEAEAAGKPATGPAAAKAAEDRQGGLLQDR